MYGFSLGGGSLLPWDSTLHLEQINWSHHVRTAQDMGQCAQPALHPSMQLRGCLPAVCSLSFTTCIVRASWGALLRPRRVTRSQPPARSPLQRLGGVAAARAYRDERAELPA